MILTPLALAFCILPEAQPQSFRRILKDSLSEHNLSVDWGEPIPLAKLTDLDGRFSTRFSTEAVFCLSSLVAERGGFEPPLSQQQKSFINRALSCL